MIKKNLIKKRILIGILAMVMCMGSAMGTVTAYADPEGQTEVVEEAEEVPEEAPIEEGTDEVPEEAPAEEDTEAPAEEAPAEEAPVAEGEPAAEGEAASVVEEPAVAQEAPAENYMQAEESASLVQMDYGYQFSDGSFDSWLGGTAVYVGNGYLISSTKAIGFSGETDERYQVKLLEKRDMYTHVGVTLASYGTNMQSFVLYAISPSGKAVQASVVATNTNGVSILKTSLTDEDVPRATIVSDTTVRQASVCGYGTAAVQALDTFTGGSFTPMSATKNNVGVLTRNGIISITGTVDTAMLGAAVMDDQKRVIGLVTDMTGTEPVAISANSFASDLVNETGIAVEGSDSANLSSAKEELQASVDTAQALDLSIYTEETASAAEEALAGAQALLEGDAVSASEYAAAKEKLDASVAALEEQPHTPFLLSTPGMVMCLAVIGIFAALIYTITAKKKRAKEDARYDWLDGPEMEEEQEAEKPAKKKGTTRKEKKQKTKAQNDPYEVKMTEPVKEKEEEGTTVLEPEEGTTILGMSDTPARLVNMKTGESIKIDRPDFVIGKSKKEDLGYRIQGNTSISRQHARIKYANGVFTIEDMGSTNGTYVNQTEISSAVKLSDGDKIRLSDMNFEFRES